MTRLMLHKIQYAVISVITFAAFATGVFYLAKYDFDKGTVERVKASCLAVAENDTECKSLQIVDYSKASCCSWVMKVKGCGRSAWYEYGEWCEDCDRTCRRAGEK